ncbi:uncharacterized protein Eint_061090 [Encephalitozoon intestinalis ATCC 50506]|uniref:Uncharacterized protein n=1 Tax=Encephalitozoon intestinalis (strain ATCC 50506) TaxID=876142 RepID=E0S7N7_ENCIT|nr:uncharacterized protein Eint_061090 [Encephalitozoon intestinalis ATCC 50506]ADM11716.1 hypothetical protein Eint_061090 [Encephalitozoon intestinalis ATCC 50506]UTX45454.1 hypothetical protein GPK93_06g10080 [Encephalitozoon intestinalis]
MVYKRKRNVKIDNGLPYAIYKPGSFDVSSLEEYVPPSLDTGMEADEEKELHLKKIMEGEKGNIPIPVITKVDNPAREIYGKYVPKRKYVEWIGDAENEYLMNNEDRRICKESGVDEKQFYGILSTISNKQDLLEGKEKFSRMVASRILIRNEKFNPLAYVCFRKRIIKPSRRSRRSEELSKEKVERMWKELHLLEALCKLYGKRNKLERDLEDVECSLLETFCLLMKNSSRKARKKMGRKILDRHGKSPKDGVVCASGTIGDIMFDRTRIRLLKQRIQEARERACLGEYDSEAQAFKKYNNLYRT